MNQEYKIGDAVHFNDQGFKRAIKQLEEMIRLINDFSLTYDQLTLGKLTHDIFMVAVNQGLSGIMERFQTNSVEAKKMQSIPLMIRNSIAGQIPEVQRNLNAKRDAILYQFNWFLRKVNAEPFEWTDIYFEKGVAAFNAGEIKEKYTVRITNDKQLKVLLLMKATKESWNSITELLEETYNVNEYGHFELYGNGKFFSENQKGILEIDPMAITFFENQKIGK